MPAASVSTNARDDSAVSLEPDRHHDCARPVAYTAGPRRRTPVINTRATRAPGIALLTTVPLLLAAPLAPADDGGYGGGNGPLAEARELIDMGSFGSPIWSLKRVLEDRPDDADAHNLLGFSYRSVERYELAEQHYGRALEIDPEHRGAHAYQGMLFRETGRAEQARANLDRLGAICGTGCPEYQELRTAIRRRGSGAG